MLVAEAVVEGSGQRGMSRYLVCSEATHHYDIVIEQGAI